MHPRTSIPCPPRLGTRGRSNPEGARLEEIADATSRAVDGRDDRLAVIIRGRPGARAGRQHFADRIEALDGRLSMDTSAAAAGAGAVEPVAGAQVLFTKEEQKLSLS